MNKLFVQGIALLFIWGMAGAQAQASDYSLDDLPKLSPESQHSTASQRVVSFFTRYHYTRVALDEEKSGEIFDRYFEQLDYNRMFLLKSDLEDFAEHRDTFHEYLNEGELELAYEIYQRSLERRFERYEYALTLIDEEMDFEAEGERYYYDRTEKPWAESREELEEIWQKRVKHDALNLAMAGREDEEVIENLQRRYRSALQRLTQQKSEDAFQSIMNAFARSADNHTSYLSPRNAERFQQNMNLSLEGIGAVLRSEYDYTVIQSLVPGGPADQSGELSPDDRIIGVAQGDKEFEDVIGWRLDDVVELITGPKGSVVRLQVLRESDGSGATPQTVEIVRDEVRLEDREASLQVREQPSGERLGIIEIPGFYNDLSKDVAKLLDEVKELELDGVIVDLRGNGGGSLEESIRLTDLFIGAGPVVQVRDSSGQVDVQTADSNEVEYAGPLVVMVDRFSASASEIFAAAIQDYNRGLVVGEQTFGKGTVQQHRGLQRRFDRHSNPMGSVQYTVAKFYRIDGGSTQHRGVIPDINYPSPVDPDEFGESRADNALPWNEIDAALYEPLRERDQEGLAKLLEQHQHRISEDQEFGYIFADIDRFKEEQNRNYVSLEKSVRQAERDEAQARNLRRVNERLARADKEPVDEVEDAPEEFREPDPYLEETLAVTVDYLNYLRSDG